MDFIEVGREMESAFRSIPEFQGLDPDQLVGRKFIFWIGSGIYGSPEFAVGTILGVAMHNTSHVSLSIPKTLIGSIICERLSRIKDSCWQAESSRGGKALRGAFALIDPQVHH